MKRWLSVTLMTACVPLLLSAQQKQFVQAELLKTIKAKTAKPGDPVKARAVNAVILPGGRTISEGAALTGQVVEASANSLTISFDQPVKLSIRAAMMPGGAQKSSADAGNSSLSVPTPDAHAMKGPAQLSDQTKNAAQNSPSNSPEGSQRPVAAQTGSVIGMPGVTLQVDETSHTSKFESSGKELQLKSGLQLMLAVQQ
jgi:hypothetical protein